MATPGEGTTLQLKITTTFTDIADVTEINGPGLQRAAVDTTNLAATVKTSRPGLLDPGEVTFTIQFDPVATTHTTLLGLMTSATISDWQIVFADPANTPLAFSGFVTGYELSNMSVEENVEASLTIHLTGAVTLGAEG